MSLFEFLRSLSEKSASKKAGVQNTKGQRYERLEDRVLFDALADAPTEIPEVEADPFTPAVEELTEAVSENVASAATEQAPQQQRNELVFVDKSVEGFEYIVADLVVSNQADVIFLSASSDGLTQIASTLEDRSDVDAIHIISHGRDGELQLGSATLNSEMTDAQRDALQQIGTSLSTEADILIYGCNVAATAVGQTFIGELASLTAADISASDDLTGAASLGGDWDLETATGSIETTAQSSSSFGSTLEAGVVEGTDGNDNIDWGYAGDPEGDTIDDNDAPDGSNDDVIRAGDGNDSINARSGTDFIDAGAGDDTIWMSGQFGQNTLIGGEGYDKLSVRWASGDLVTTLTGPGSGHATNGTSTAEFSELEEIHLSAQHNTLVLQEGFAHATVRYFATPTQNPDGTYTAADVIDASGLFKADGAAVSVDDVVVADDGSGNAVLVFGGESTLTMIGVAPEQLNSEAALLAAGLTPATIEGTAANDNITGTNASEQIQGGQGDDVINGGGGHDLITAGEGDDTISLAGDFGNDVIIGGSTGETTGDRLLLDSAAEGQTVVLSGQGEGLILSSTGATSFSEIEHITLSGHNDQLTLRPGFGITSIAGFQTPTVDTDGSLITHDTLNITALISADETAATVDNVSVADNGSGDTLVTFHTGDSLLLTGVSVSSLDTVEKLAAIGIPASPTVGTTDADTLSGTSDHDSILAGDGDDVVEAGAGDDVLLGGTGSDELDGGAGDDMIDGGAGADIINGGAGNDVINGGDGRDNIDGGAGDDTIVLSGNFDIDTLNGGSSEEVYGDTLDLSETSEGQRVTLWGDGAGQVYNGSAWPQFSEIEHIVLSDFDDTIVLQPGFSIASIQNFQLPTTDADGQLTVHDRLDVAPFVSNDGIAVTTDNITITDDDHGHAVIQTHSGETLTLAGITAAQLDTQTLVAIGIAQPIDGTNEADTFTGEAGNDTVNTLAGDDTIDTADGNDVINAGSGNDTVNAGAGNDYIDGGSGDDIIDAGDGNDALTGGDGNDTLIGGAGSDKLYVSNGNDVLDGGSGWDAYLLAKTEFEDTAVTVNLETGTDSFGNTITNIESIRTGTANDTIIDSDAGRSLNTGEGDDTIHAAGGNDWINPGEGDDTVFLGDGHDRVWMADQYGNDTITGGEDGTGIDTIILGPSTGDQIVTLAAAGSGTVTNGTSLATFSQIERIDLDAGSNSTIVLTQDLDTFELRYFTAPAPREDGSMAATHTIDVSGMTNADGSPITTTDVTVSDSSGNAVLTFSGGQTLTLTGVDAADLAREEALIAVGIPATIISGTEADDTLNGAATAESIDAGNGHNTVSAGAGNDTVFSGSGNDVIDAGEGHDRIDAGAGDDNITGGDGDDTIFLSGDYGNDVISGGTGGEFTGDTLSLAQATGDQTITLTGYGTGTVSNGTSTAQFSDIEQIVLSSAKDTVVLQPGFSIGSLENFQTPWIDEYGEFDLLSQLDVSALQTPAGEPVYADDITVTEDADGNAVLEFPDGETLTIAGKSAASFNSVQKLASIGIPTSQSGSELSDSLAGTDGHDTVDAGEGDNTVNAGGGDDTVTAGSGNDTIDAGTGNDTVNAGDGNNTVDGGEGNDTITAGTGDDTLSGGVGSDAITAGAGNDVLDGGEGDDVLNAGAGDDMLYGGVGNDTIIASAGNNVVDGGEGNDSIESGTGNDTITGGVGDDTVWLNGQFGNDTITGGEGVDTLRADLADGDLTVTLSGSGAGSISNGTSNADFAEMEHVALGSGNNTLALEDGFTIGSITNFTAPVDNGDGTFAVTDTLDTSGITNANGSAVSTDDVTVTDDGSGNAVLSFPNGESLTLVGVDPSALTEDAMIAIGIPAAQIEAGTGDDTVVATDADETVDAGEGDNTVNAGGGDDTVTAGAGNDTIDAGTGNDTVNAGDGNNTVDGGEGNDTITAGTGDDTLSGGIGSDAITAGAGNDVLDGGEGDDVLNAGAGDDMLYGGAGNDTIIAAAGNNVVDGGEGSDSIESGTGDDTITGGVGDDTVWLNGQFGNDTITGGDGVDTLRADLADGDPTVTLSGDGAGSITNGTSNADFAEMEHVALGSGNNTLALEDGFTIGSITNFTAPVDNGDGTFAVTDTLDTSAITNANGSAVSTDDVTVTDDGSGNAVLSFPNGESLTLVGVDPSALTDDAMIAIGIPAAQIEAGTGDDTVVATDADETVDAGEGDNTVNAGGGDDTVTAGAGNDTIDAGTGNDTVNAGDGNNTVDGGEGNDSITAGTGDDTLSGGIGSDTITAGAGNDFLDGGEGDDVLDGGAGNDTFLVDANAGSDTITGGDGYDSIDASSLTSPQAITIGPDSGSIAGLDSDLTFSDVEHLTLPAGDTTVSLSADFTPMELAGFQMPEVDANGVLQAADLLDVSAISNANGSPVGTDDVIATADGSDLLLSFPGGETLRLTNAASQGVPDDATLAAMGIPASSLDGSSDSDTTIGSDVDETIDTGGGNDTINAGAGDDAAFGGAGDDIIDGGAGNDSLHGDAPQRDSDSGRDIIDGGTGDDVIDGGWDDDTLLGGSGNDTIVDSGSGADQIDGGTGDDFLDGGSGSDTISGGEGDDTIFGGQSTHPLLADGGDLIDGGAGNDTIDGGSGADTIDGGTGDDTILGGHGDDTIQLSDGFGNDIIDGGDDIDRLDLSFLSSAVTVDLSATQGNSTISDGINTAVFSNVEEIVLPQTESVIQLGTGFSSQTLVGFKPPVAQPDGSWAPGDQFQPGDLVNSAGSPIGAGEIVISASENGDAVLSFPGGETLTLANTPVSSLSHHDALVAMGFPASQIDGSASDDVLAGGSGDESLSGGEGSDTLDGGAGHDALDGGTGNDILTGGEGNDSLAGGDGSDTLSGGSGQDEIFGGSGNDSVDGGDGADAVSGGAGNDTVSGGGGDDQLSGDAGNDILQGGDGDDVVAGGTGHDELFGGTGDDQLTGGEGDDRTEGGQGSDTLSGGAGADRLFGGSGGDSLEGGSGSDQLFGGEGDDSLQGGEGSDVLLGGVGLDTLDGGDGADTLDGESGDDVLAGGGGDDTVAGGDGNDTLNGGTGQDTLHGGNGNDVLLGDDGSDDPAFAADVLDGGAGNDMLDGGAGHDLLLGGTGDDTLRDTGASGDILRGGAGSDIVDGGLGDDLLSGGSGDDQLSGGSGEDRLHGGAGDDVGHGGAGNDVLIDAGSGHDELHGGEGEDRIHAGSGDDVVAGDEGDDMASGGGGSDVIDGGTGNDTLYGDAGVLDPSLFPSTEDDLSPVSFSLQNSSGQSVQLQPITDSGELDQAVTLAAGESISPNGHASQNWAITSSETGEVLELLTGLENGQVVMFESPGSDSLSGGDGSDTLYGQQGDDSLSGDAGDDVLDGGLGDDELHGGSGNDELIGGSGDDQLDGGDGDDILIGGGGNDTLLTSPGTDNLSGGDGDDTFQITSLDGTHTITGGTTEEVSGDTLDLSASVEGLAVDLTDAADGSGQIIAGDGTATFSEIEEVVLTGEQDTIVLNNGSGSIRLRGFRLADVTAGDLGGPGDVLDVSAMTDLAGRPVGTSAVQVSADSSGDAVLNFPQGQSITLAGIPAETVDDDALTAMGIPASEHTGTPHDDIIDGSLVDETIVAGSGNDIVHAGDGHDLVDAGFGNDSVDGQSGNDSVFGGPGDDTVFGGAGDDTLGGGDGHDILDGGSGNDVLEGNDGNDILSGGDGSDQLIGGDGNDMLGGGDASDLLIGGAGNDTLYGGADADILEGGVGDDLIVAGAGDDFAYGGDGQDEILADAGDDIVLGLEGSDVLSGGTGFDRIEGGSSDDIISGGDGSDQLFGGDGADIIHGDDGNDVILGGEGDDTLHGGSGHDTIRGESGSDRFVLQNQFGNDEIDGGDDANQEVDELDASQVAGGVTVLFSDTSTESGELVQGSDRVQFEEIELITLSAGSDTLVIPDGSGQISVAGLELSSLDGHHDVIDVTGVTTDSGDPVSLELVTVGDDGQGNAVLQLNSQNSVRLVGITPDEFTAETLAQVLLTSVDELSSDTSAEVDGAVEESAEADANAVPADEMDETPAADTPPVAEDAAEQPTSDSPQTDEQATPQPVDDPVSESADEPDDELAGEPTADAEESNEQPSSDSQQTDEQVTPQPVDDPVSESASESADELAGEPTADAEESNEQPTSDTEQTNEQVTPQPVDDPVGETASESAGEPTTVAEESNEQPSSDTEQTDEQVTPQPVDDPVGETADGLASEPAADAEESNEQPTSDTEQTDEQVTPQPVDDPVSESASELASELASEPADELSGEPTADAEESTEQPSSDSQQTDEQVTPQPVDDPVSESADELAAESPVMQSEQSVESGEVITADEVTDLVLTGSGGDPTTPLWLTFTDAQGTTVGPVQAVVDDHGNWESPSIDLSELQDGAVAVSMEEPNESGELIPAGETTLQLQTELPAASDIVTVGGPVTGNLFGEETLLLDGAPSGQLMIGAINGEPLTPDEPLVLPSGATLTVNADGSFEYVAGEAYTDLAPGQLAADAFTYTVVDGDGNESPGTFVVNMTGVSSNPTAQDDVIATSVDTPVTVAVLDNDSSVDGQALSVVILSDSGLGTAAVNDDGSITFTPNPGVTGTVRVEYLVETDDGRADTATLHVDVVPAFQFDSINDFSQGFAGSSSSGQFRPLASRSITTLTPDPVFSGTARPGSSVIARVYDEAGNLVTEQQGETDQGGHWLLQARGLHGQTDYNVDFAYAGGGSPGYGDFRVEASTHTYRPRGSAAQWGLTDWARRQFNSLQQMHDENGNPIDL